MEGPLGREEEVCAALGLGLAPSRNPPKGSGHRDPEPPHLPQLSFFPFGESQASTLLEHWEDQALPILTRQEGPGGL